MHYDLMHAVVTGLIVFVVMWVFRKAGWNDGKRFDWRMVVTVAVVVFLFNLIWPV
ncbi:hypothetical protein [Ruegeria arenilitoris]|uniref:hypothetical protein n=1 Tax=Ruegeria arenilitoris TaxID=1173585 RepID=UPI00147E69E8|nr:hypothetical protein [Ruegeria arenilitoris]